MSAPPTDRKERAGAGRDALVPLWREAERSFDSPGGLAQDDTGERVRIRRSWERRHSLSRRRGNPPVSCLAEDRQLTAPFRQGGLVIGEDPAGLCADERDPGRRGRRPLQRRRRAVPGRRELFQSVRGAGTAVVHFSFFSIRSSFHKTAPGARAPGAVLCVCVPAQSPMQTPMSRATWMMG